MIDKILVPTDGSRHAVAALDFAIDVAVRHSAALYLQHVVAPVESSSATTRLARIEGLPAALQQEVRRSPRDPDVWIDVGREVLARAEQRATSIGPLRVHTRLDEGDPAHEILACAEHEKVDMIVTGSRGLGLAREIFIGSVSSKLQQMARCPCCIVKLQSEPMLFGRLKDLS